MYPALQIFALVLVAIAAALPLAHALELPGGANDYIVWGNLGDACRFLPEGSARAREAYGKVPSFSPRYEAAQKKLTSA